MDFKCLFFFSHRWMRNKEGGGVSSVCAAEKGSFGMLFVVVVVVGKRFDYKANIR